MYKNWKILKSIIWYEGDDEKKLQEKKEALEEYKSVAIWCNEGQEYTIDDSDKEYYRVIPIPELTEEEKKYFTRDTRDYYLETYVDPLVTNPLRWADLSEEEQNQIKEYRLYLLNYTENENWWDKLPETFEEWLNA